MRTNCGGLRQAFLVFLFFALSILPNAGCSFAQAQPRVLNPVDNGERVTLTGNVHPLARAEFDRGEVDDALPMMRMLLLLRRSDAQELALQDYLEQQQDRSSPNYHVWLTPEQFGTLYGPADADIQAVTQWLGSQGFRIEKVYTGKAVIEFSGTAGQVRSAFGATIRNYQLDKKTHVANANDPQIPAALAPVLTGVVSLNNFPRQSHMRVAGAAKIVGKFGSEPLFTFPNPFGGSGNFYALAPGDFAKIYNSAPLIQATTPIDGTGQSIAVVGETNIAVSDVQAFRSLFGLSSTFTAANVILNGVDPGITSVGEEGEADLDTQWSGAVAPGATVNLVVSASTSSTAGIDLSAEYIVEHNLVGVMSESYGNCESFLGTAGNAFYKSLWEQAAAQGITVIVSTGDSGSAGCDDFNTATAATQGLAVSGLASTPFNVAVGGTDFDQVNRWSTFWSAANSTTGTDSIGTSAVSYIPEIPWNESCAQISLTGCTTNPPANLLNIVAGSGGQSTCSTSTTGGTCAGGYPKPTWQMGVTGMPNDNHRDVPDVSLFASPGFNGSGYIVCQADAYANLPCSITTPGGVNVQIVGGTSAAAPAFAGVMALVNQYEATHGGTNRQGNANYVLYSLAKRSGASCTSSASEAASCIFNDIVRGSSVLPTGGAGLGTNSVPCEGGGSPNCSVSTPGGKGVLVDPNNPAIEAWTATAGYDLVTGLGSLNIANLATNWGTVNTVSTTTALALTPTTNIIHGSAEDVSVQIAVTPKSGTATGDVSLIAKLADGTTQGLDQFTLGANGSFSGTTQSLPGGTYTVTAHYAGDGTNAPSDSTPPVSITVTAESSKTLANLVTLDINNRPISFTAGSSMYGNEYAIFRVDVGDSAANVSSSSGITSNCARGITNCPTGVVALASTGASLGTTSLTLNNAGYAETKPLPPGNYSITASYPGDAGYGPSASSASFVINKGSTAVTVGTAGSPVEYGNSEQIAANVATTSTGVAPTGTFQFLVDGTAVGGPVSVYESGPYKPGGNPPNYAWADASSTTEFMSVGNHSLVTQYSGDSNYAAGTSSPAAVAVMKALPFFNTFGASPGSTNVNQQVTLTAQLFGSDAGGPPTGTITFYDGTTALAGAATYTPVNATQLTGSALKVSMPYTPTTVGTHSITATYLGDGNYQAATTPTAATLTVIGPDFTLTPLPSTVTVVAGNPATYTIAVAGTNGFNATVNVTCSLIATGTTCSANPASVAPGSSVAVTVTTTVHQGIAPSPFIKPLGPRLPIGSVSLFVALALVLLSYKRIAPQRRFIVTAAFAGLIICGSLVAAGCGGGGGSSGSGGSVPPLTFGTQAGTYVVTISATSGTTTHTTTVSLSVQ